ncbi:MAG: hypothetical protein ACREP9_13415, partial [Candidatus Dormibacteraceae bacterium]
KIDVANHVNPHTVLGARRGKGRYKQCEVQTEAVAVQAALAAPWRTQHTPIKSGPWPVRLERLTGGKPTNEGVNRTEGTRDEDNGGTKESLYQQVR